MKPILVLAVLAALSLAPLAHAAPQAEPQAPRITQDIASAGQLRLQSQRLAKLWLQAGLGINAGAATGLLARGAAQFDTSLLELAHYSKLQSTRHSLQRINELWIEYRIALSLPYNEANLNQVNYLAEDLMIATGKLTMKIEAEGSTGVGRLLDLSMRQNMLAQRLARLYLLTLAGDRSQGRLVDIDQTKKEFATALQELSNARENTPSSREALELARMQWMFFDQAISEMKKGDNSRPQNVVTTSERIMETLDVVSRQYAQDYSNTRLATTAENIRRN